MLPVEKARTMSSRPLPSCGRHPTASGRAAKANAHVRLCTRACARAAVASLLRVMQACPLPDGVGRCCRVVTPKSGKLCGTKFAIELKVMKGGRLVPTKHCPRHRAYKEKYAKNNKPKVQESKRKHASQPSAKEAQALRRATPEGKAARKREAEKDRASGAAAARMATHRSQPHAKLKHQEESRTPKAKALKRAAWKKRMRDPAYRLAWNLNCKVSRMLRSGAVESRCVAKHTGIASNQDLRDHVQNTFPPDGSLGWHNYGRRTSTAQNQLYWELGHIIARSMYNPSIPEDIRRCWSFSNLFAQDGKENNSLRVRLPSEDRLLSLRPIWPTAWNNVLPDASRRRSLESAARRGKQAVAA